MKTHWIISGLKKEINSLKDFRTWLLMTAWTGAGLLLIMLGLNPNAVGTAWIISSIVLFILMYRGKND